jgi:hypothetical protein
VKKAPLEGEMRKTDETSWAAPESGGSQAMMNDRSLPANREAPRWLVSAFLICVLISVATVIRRLLALAYPSQSGPPQMLALDAVFASRTTLTLAHIVPALIFVLLTPFVLLRRDGRSVWFHAALFPLGAIVGVTAYAMSVHAVGGWIERSAVLLFNSLFLYSLIRAYGYWRVGDLVIERRWLTRAIGILLGIATTRPVMGVFFATSSLTHLSPAQFFGIAFWIGFSINTVSVELWLAFSSSGTTKFRNDSTIGIIGQDPGNVKG